MEFALSLRGLKGTGSTTDLFRAGRTVAGRGTSGMPPGDARYFESASLSELGDHLLCGSPDGSLPPSRERLVGDATRPATSGPHHATMGTESTDGPHWGGGDRPSPCFGAPPALGRGLRHPAACAFAVHHPCCRHLGPTPKGGRVKSMPGMEGTRLARRGWAKRKAREQQASTGCARSTGQSLTWRQQLVPVDHPDPRWPAADRESRERPVDGGLRRQRRGAK